MNHLVRSKPNRTFLLFLCLVFFLSCGKAQTGTSSVSPSAEAKATEAAMTVDEVELPTPDPNAATACAPADTPEPVLSEPEETPSAEPAAVTPESETPEPVVTPVPVTDEQLDEGYLDAWFDDSVLIGDSLVAGLTGYVTAEKDKGHPCLGNMQLVGASALTLKKALGCEKKERDAELKYRTRYMTVSEVVDAVHAKRLFIMLGTNDIRWYSADELTEVYGELLRLIKDKHPDLRIYIHSVMPMIKKYAQEIGVTVEMGKAANEKLRAFCEENGYTYLELADLVRDDEGYLTYDYSAQDYRFHLNGKGKAFWVRLLRSCARDEYYAGIWSPEEIGNE